MGIRLLRRPVSLTWNLYISPLRMLLSTVPPKMYMASEITAAAWKSLPLGSWLDRGQVSKVGKGRTRSPEGSWLRPGVGHAVGKDVAPLALREGSEQALRPSCRHRAGGRAGAGKQAGWAPVAHTVDTAGAQSHVLHRHGPGSRAWAPDPQLTM